MKLCYVAGLRAYDISDRELQRGPSLTWTISDSWKSARLAGRTDGRAASQRNAAQVEAQQVLSSWSDSRRALACIPPVLYVPKGIVQHGIFYFIYLFFCGLVLVGRSLRCMKQCVWEFYRSGNIHLNARTELCTGGTQWSDVISSALSVCTFPLSSLRHFHFHITQRGVLNLKQSSVLLQQCRDLCSWS